MSKRLLGPVAVMVFLRAPSFLRLARAKAVRYVLPEGNGKGWFAACTSCHAVNMITQGWGYNRQGWERGYRSMVTLPDADRSAIAAYLGTHFAEKTRPATVVVPGTASVEIKEWVVPSLGSRPHDPLRGGRRLPLVDRAMGARARTAGSQDRCDEGVSSCQKGVRASRPADDAAGNIWYTGNGKSHVGKLDPKTGEVTEYPMPDPAARDPHTPIFDQKGQLWFSLQGANMVGRLNPQTGEIKLVTIRIPLHPYGMVVSSTGVPFSCEFGTNRIASFDPDTMASVNTPSERRNTSAPHRDHQRRVIW